MTDTYLHKSYPSFENHDHKSIELILENKSEDEFIASEKIHGSNVSVIVTETDFFICKRSGIIGENEKFFDVQSNMTQFLQRLKELKEKFKQSHKIQVYGEYFGCSIQPKVNYGNKYRWIIFDISIDNVFLSLEQTIDLCLSVGLPCIKIIHRGLLKDLLHLDPIFYSMYGFENQLSEGYVIRHITDHNLMIKLKNQKFIHKQLKTSVASVASVVEVSEIPEIPEIPDSDSEFLNDDILECIFGNVISKLNEIERKNKGLIIKNMKLDIKKSFKICDKIINANVLNFLKTHPI